MTDFKWSSEANGKAANAIQTEAANGLIPGYMRDTTANLLAKASLEAAVKAHPVVDLPPCQTCNGTGMFVVSWSENFSQSQASVEDCPICNGSGYDRLIPVSEVVKWLEAREVGTARIADFHRWINEQEER